MRPTASTLCIPAILLLHQCINGCVWQVQFIQYIQQLITSNCCKSGNLKGVTDCKFRVLERQAVEKCIRMCGENNYNAFHIYECRTHCSYHVEVVEDLRTSLPNLQEARRPCQAHCSDCSSMCEKQACENIMRPAGSSITNTRWRKYRLHGAETAASLKGFLSKQIIPHDSPYWKRWEPGERSH